MRLHRRPFRRDDAVDRSVAQRSVRRNLVVAQNAVEFCPEPLDAAATLLIEEMGAEFYRNAIELLEGVAQQHQFALGVERGALHTLGIPCRADFDPAVWRVDV